VKYLILVEGCSARNAGITVEDIFILHALIARAIVARAILFKHYADVSRRLLERLGDYYCIGDRLSIPGRPFMPRRTKIERAELNSSVPRLLSPGLLRA
jgi:hypothetical protein